MKIKCDVLHQNHTTNMHRYRISLLFNNTLIIRMENKEKKSQKF